MKASAQWRGQPDTGRRRLWTLLCVSSLLHAPLTPWAALFGLLGLIGHDDSSEFAAAPPITAIPIDLVSSDDFNPGAERKAPEAKQPPSEPDLKDPFDELNEKEPDEAPAVVEARDAGANNELADATEQAADSADLDGGLDAGAQHGGGDSIGDPVALSGAAGRIADSNANVRVILYTDRIRNHPLGSRVGAVLGQVYQWRDFFGPAGLDPINDIDRILIAGPQFRDSSEVVAVLHYNVSKQRMLTAIDALVRRDATGGWIDGGTPAARARADRAERLFLLPAPNLVVVVPPSAEKHALSLGAKTRFPASPGPEALTAYIVTPWRVFIGLPFKFPQTIKWLKIKLTATPSGGGVATIIAEDESKEAASQNAEALENAISAATRFNLGALGSFFGRKETRFIESVSFSSQGKEIHGELVVTAKQFSSLLEMAAQVTKDMADRAARRARSIEGMREAGSGAPEVLDASSPSRENERD